jgi:hypothetical protein
MKKTQARTFGAALAVIGLLGAGACGDPAGLDDHADAEGAVVSLGGQVVASYDGGTRQWTGEFTVPAGRSTGRMTVTFVDHDGDDIRPGSAFYLQVDFANTGPTVAAFDHDAPGTFTGALRGMAAGQSTVVFRLMHGSVGRGHPDFSTAPATVRVTG